MKALQAMLLSSGLLSKVFKSGCLMGSLEKIHSFSLLKPLEPRPPPLPTDLREEGETVSAGQQNHAEILGNTWMLLIFVSK